MKYGILYLALFAASAHATNDITMPPPTTVVVHPPKVNNHASNTTRVSTSNRTSTKTASASTSMQSLVNNPTTSVVSNPSVSTNPSQTVIQNDSRRPVSSAYAPAVQPTAPCTTSFGVGGQSVGGGVSVGGSAINDGCMRQELAKTAATLGDMRTAEEILCDDDSYRNARKRTGRPCAKVEATPEERAVYSGSDPIVRARFNMQPLRD